MRIRYSPRATRDLDAIHEYLAERSPRGAVKRHGGDFCVGRIQSDGIRRRRQR